MIQIYLFPISFIISIPLLLISAPIYFFKIHKKDESLKKQFLRIIAEGWIHSSFFIWIILSVFFFIANESMEEYGLLIFLALAISLLATQIVSVFYIGAKYSKKIQHKSYLFNGNEHQPYIRKSWANQAEAFSKDSILPIIEEIQTTSSIERNFLVGLFDEGEYTFEVHKDLTIVANLEQEDETQITIKATNWQEVEFLLKLFLSKQFMELKNRLNKNYA